MRLLRHWQRSRLRGQLFPDEWRRILATGLAISRYLPAAVRSTLEQHIQVFLAEKRFEGCGGLVVTDVMRVIIAGHACLLLLGDPDDYYPRLGTVVLYPESFAAPLQATDHLGIVTETVEERLGESWEEGTVVLAWDSIAAIARGSGTDCNVILHEFAHQIDTQRGLTSDSRLLVPDAHCRNWEELLQVEKSRQRTAQRRGRPTLLDPYAFNSPEELFAVATEACFTRPVRFLAGHPELYRELQAVYGLDPANWIAHSMEGNS